MSGHLFVVQADLTSLFCDAWLMPSDRSFYVVDYWVPDAEQDSFQRVSTRVFGAKMEATEAWDSEAVRSIELQHWKGPIKPYITNVGGSATHPPEWYAESARQFFEAASKPGPRHTKRTRPLLALPAIGTGYGGQWRKKAGVIEAVMRQAYDTINDLDVDIVFVAFDGPTFAAAQNVRAKIQAELHIEFELDQRLRDEAVRLSKVANAGELVLFLGAGVSAGAGLPLWDDLLRSLANRAGLDHDEIRALDQLDVMDRGLVVERRLGGREALEEEIRKLVDVRHHSIAHSLLAALPTDAVVTLNYDRLFERASEPIVGPVAVIPNESGAEANRWLLKLHGCIKHGQLVLTREDYLRFGDRRAALAGIVQSLLITRHMLFVGFGMTDPNFFRILDDVRKAVPGHSDRRQVGTVLTLQPNPLRDALWDDDLRIAAMSNDSGSPMGESIRMLELFLDYLVSLSASRPGHIMDSSFDSLLTKPEREFRDELKRLKERYGRDMEGGRVWFEYMRFLEALGNDEDSR